MKRPKRVLVVDDDARTRMILKAMAESLGHEAEDARDGFEALAMLKLGFDIVLLDIVMPGMDGLEVTREIRQDPDLEDIPIIMVTALGNKEDRIRALKAGANDFISKPIDLTELAVRTGILLKMKEAQDDIKRNRTELEEMLEKRTSILRKTVEELGDAKRKAHQAHLETIQRLALAAEYKDKETGVHIRRLGHYSALLGRNLDLSSNEIDIIFHACPMHDVGKLGIPDKNLLKPGKLDPGEWDIMKKHTTIGGRLLSGSSSELLQAGEIIALSHHERWDGKGYPKGIAEEEIPLSGRICAVSDVFDALTSNRPYKKAYSNKNAYEILREGRGTHFDPRVTDVFFDRLEEVEAIQAQIQGGELMGTLA